MAKNFKRALILGISYLLVAALAIGGTVAYLTDRESITNVFTVGTVDITLDEKFPEDTLIPGEKLQKEATIKNIGNNEAWVWMTVAIPVALEDQKDPADASKNVLHWNYPGAFSDKYYLDSKFYSTAPTTPADGDAFPVDWGDTWNVDDKVPVQKNVSIDGVLYNIYTLLYNGKLEKDEVTNVGLTTVYFDSKVDVDPKTGEIYLVKDKELGTAVWDLDTDDDGKIDNQPKVIVSAYAIQDDASFASVLDAYNAYTAQWGKNGGKATTDTDVTVTTAP